MNPRLLKPSLVIAVLLMVVLMIVMGQPAMVNASTSQQGWTLAWSDEFNGTGQPSSANWNYHVGNGFNPGLAGFDGWGNGEWEWYRPENCYQQNGSLVMRADYNTNPTVIAGRNWYQHSCRITSDTKKSFTYGAIEARIQMPNNIGTWPAFWMMGDACDDTSTGNYAAPMSYYDTMASNWASCGEVDIMEHRNTETVTFQNLFWDTRVGVFPWSGTTIGNAPTQFNVGSVATYHTYRLEWTATQMKWLVDGAVAKTQDISPANMEEFRKPFHLIMNLALSGQFTGNAAPNQAEFPLYMRVDYVRHYTAGGSNTPIPTTPVGPTFVPPTTVPPTQTGGNGSMTLFARSGGVLSTSAGSGAGTVTVASAGGVNRDGVVTNPQTFTISGLTKTYQGATGNSKFNVFIDSGAAVGNGIQVKVSYDFTGNGSWDRSETYQYFATDDVAGNQDYNQTSFGGLKSSSGTYSNLANGKVKIEVWSAIGTATSTVRVNATSAQGQQSKVIIPFQ
jgi:beta-glucanase (GH16 family)